MKLHLFSKRSFDIPSKTVGEEGQRITGTMYAGWLESGKAIEFSSQNPNHVVDEGAPEYDDKKAVNLAVQASLFAGKVKYREAIFKSTEPTA